MNALKYIVGACLIGVTFFGCETEVDIFTDHKQRAVIFGVLNPGDTIQYFRINPTFIGEGDARDIASDPSTTNFAPGEVSVQLIDISDDLKTYDCEETTDIPLNSDGIFSTQNMLYYLKTPVTIQGKDVVNEVLVPFHTYRLLVTHNTTGEQYYADAQIGDFNEINLTVPSNVNLDSRRKYINFHTGSQYVDYSFTMAAANYVERYQLTMRYYYTEDGDDPESKAKFVDIDLGQIRPEELTTSTPSIMYDGEDFYSTLSNRLAGMELLTGQRCDIYVTAVGKELDAYINVQDASLNNISAEQTSYTNVNNGIGVFSFRTTKVFTNIMINEESVNQLDSRWLHFSHLSLRSLRYRRQQSGSGQVSLISDFLS